ncbi:MAG: hypothetical protein C5B49_15855 [Bdellovibrio sp.]|nr:MAG: hypothetical protein C5B49_15855 [Bdellovibrio sp.]
MGGLSRRTAARRASDFGLQRYYLRALLEDLKSGAAISNGAEDQVFSVQVSESMSRRLRIPQRVTINIEGLRTGFGSLEDAQKELISVTERRLMHAQNRWKIDQLYLRERR